MLGWILRMAWRDSRRQRGNLLLFGSSMALGVAALAALASFRQNLRTALDQQSRALVGADLVLNSSEPFDRAQEALIQSLGGEQAREARYSSMILFEAGGQSRLVQARLVTGDYPFYGRFETTPPEAAAEFRAGRGALVEQSLLLQYGAKAGDAIRVGDARLKVAGSLDKTPGENLVFSMIAPRVYIRRAPGSPELLKRGSLANYRVYFRFPPGRDVDALVKTLQADLDRLRLRPETVSLRKRQLGNAFEGLDHFLNLIALIALALGGLGISSALAVHLREKRTTMAILRCLGCSFRQTLGIYLAQSLALGAAGVVVGLALGLVVQVLLPRAFAGLLPFQAEFALEGQALASAAGYGLAIAAVFGLLPLLEIRRVSPLGAIRYSFEAHSPGKPDPARVSVWLLIAAMLAAFCMAHSARRAYGLGMAGGLLAALGVLAGIAQAMIWSARRLNSRALPYVVRQGLANLHRPRNRTLLLTVVLGAGAVLILTVHLTQSALRGEFARRGEAGAGNTVLMDVQSDQMAGLQKLMREKGLPVVESAPVVAMRLASVNGTAVEKLAADKSRHRGGWAYRREYRSSYEARLRGGEKILAGQWPAPWKTNDPVAPVSIEAGIARELGVGLGDSLGFDVQGIPVAARVASVREVEWRRVQPNFFVIFPPGAVDDATSFHVVVTKTETPGQSAEFQQAALRLFPNISIIDLRMIMQTIDSIAAKAESVTRFMAGFTFLTGLIVLAGAMANSRRQRIGENALLRTLGASKRQLLQILAVEYAALGTLAGAAATGLSMAAAWALCRFVLKIDFAPSLAILPFVWLILAALAVATGLLGAGRVLDQPPLEVLRSEG